MLSMATLAGCRFDSTGLGQSGEAGSNGEGTTMGGQEGTGSTGSTGSTGGASQGSASGESGGFTGESGDSSGGVDPGTGSTTGATTTGASTTGASTTGPATTTGADTTTAGESSSGGCTEMAFFEDKDGDGFGDPGKMVMACEPPDGHVANDDDCDDGDLANKPGGDEVCDGQDNDCDQLTDEWNPPMNTDCGGCKMALHDDKVYHFCTTVERWDDARKGCEARGVALAEDTDTPEHDWLVNELPGNSGAWYIGADSPNKDDKFVWLGGSAVPDPDLRWGVTRPAGTGTTYFLSLVSNGNLNFWANYNGKWYDRAENEEEPYICEGPLPP